MIAFNYNIYFQDEALLDDGIYDLSKDDLYVVESTDVDLFNALAVKSDYMPMSGRTVCYGAEKVYRVCGTGCTWGLDVKGVVSLVWKCGEHIISYLPQEHFAAEILQFWTLHTILPMLFILEKRYEVLHVGAVEIAGYPVVFSAPSFGGKSTLVDFFLQRGHRLYSDDTLGVYREGENFMAVASFPFHRPYRDPESLGYKTDNFATHPKPLNSVYILEKCEVDTAVVIKELKGVEKYRSFHFSTFIEFDFLKSHRFQNLGMIVDAVPVYKVCVPWDLQRLDEVYRALIMHCKNKI